MTKSNLQSRVEIMQFVLPEHLNHMHNMHGGEIMKLMDNAAGLVFVRHAEGDAVTAGVKDLKMIKPIPAKSVVRCIGELIETGRTSMKVHVQVLIEDVITGSSTVASEGLFTGVAVDAEGKPRPVASVIREASV